VIAACPTDAVLGPVAADVVIAADGGLTNLAAHGLSAGVAVGDMDSADPEAPEQARRAGATVCEHGTVKGQVDLELALEASAEPSAEAAPFSGDPRFVLGVDLVGVVADYAAGFAAFVAEERGVEPASLPTRSSYHFSEWGIDRDEYEELHRRAVVGRRLLARLAVLEGAADALWRLSDAGVWIRVITHRLYVNWGHAEAVTDTVSWLDEHSIPYRDICFLGDKPEVGADCYIEDAPHNIAALRAGGNDVIVFDQFYNRQFGQPRASSWPEVEKQVVERLVRWRGPLGVQTQIPGFDPGVDRLSRRRSRG